MGSGKEHKTVRTRRTLLMSLNRKVTPPNGIFLWKTQHFRSDLRSFGPIMRPSLVIPFSISFVQFFSKTNLAHCAKVTLFQMCSAHALLVCHNERTSTISMAPSPRRTFSGSSKIGQRRQLTFGTTETQEAVIPLF